MTKTERNEMVLAAARLYCHGQAGRRLKRNQIARVLGTTSAQVTRWIDEAERKKIIEYRFDPPRVSKLEMELKQAYPFLVEVRVLPFIDDFDVARLVRGRAVADYFEENVRDGMTVALAGGNTLYEMALALPDRVRSIDIVPAAIIGRGPVIDHIDPAVLVTVVWAKSGGKPSTHGPRSKASKGARAYSTSLSPFQGATVDGPARAALAVKRLAAELETQKPVHTVLERCRNADIVFTSCGPLEVHPKYRKHFRNTTVQLLEQLGITKDWLAEQGIAGDVCYTPIDSEGQGKPEWQFFPSLVPADLRRIAATKRKRVVLTAGAYTSQSVRAVLAGRLCNVVILDENEARQLLA